MIRLAAAAALLLAAASPVVAAEPTPARALRTLAELVSNEDYPADAMAKQQEGTVRFRLDIGANGRGAACTILQSSGHASLDAATCRILMERARFVPARDSDGQPTTDTVTAQIVWKIGRDEPAGVPAEQLPYFLWSSCVWGEAAKLLPGDLPADVIPPRALEPCLELEAPLSARIGSAGMAEARAEVTRIIVKSVGMYRPKLRSAPKGN